MGNDLINFINEREQVRPRDVAAAGFNPDMLYHLAKSGQVERVGRGLYRAIGVEAGEHEDIANAAQLVPHGVISLLSALSVHRLGTQIPSAVWIAVDRAKTHSRPRIHHLNVEYVWFSGPAFTEGRERHQIHGVNVQVYSAAKTVADLFKYRHKIGEDVAIEALREGLRERRFSPAQLEYFARVCRVWSVIQPYMKGVIG